jgi:4-azaleucine resistance transporter AzlC
MRSSAQPVCVSCVVLGMTVLPRTSHDISLEVRDGFRDILPAAIAAIPIGLLFGALCVGKGLSPLDVALMSALVCAGAAQFASIEIWGYPVPVAAVVFSTLLVNVRNVLMSASLAPKTGTFTPLQRMVGFYVLSDENWAFSERRAASRPLKPPYFLTMGAVLYVNWVCWTTVGAFAGALFGDPRRLGADFAFTALFIGLVAGFWKGRSTAATVAVSAVASALTYVVVGPPWHVAAGALAGVAAAYLSANRHPT